MAAKRRSGMQKSLMAAAALCALVAPQGLQSQDVPAPAASEASWEALGLDDYATLLRRELPRPRPRPPIQWVAAPRIPTLRPERRAETAVQLAAQNLAEAEALRLSELNELPAAPPQPIVLAAPQAEPPLPVAPPSPVPAAPAAPVEVAPPPTPAAVVVVQDQPSLIPAELPVEAAPTLVPLPLIRTSDYKPKAFFADRRTREEAWLAAEGDARGEAALELVRLMISQMLIPEARAYHNRARDEGLLHDPTLDRRWKALEHMLNALSGKGLAGPVPEGWEEASLWALATNADPNSIGGALDLTEAVSQLQNHSEQVISKLLPMLFNAAMNRGDLRVAELLLRGAREATHLAETPIYHLMMGRLALAYDRPEAAFDYFARAAAGRDLSAQRARIAMADLALRRKDPKLLPALREILREGVNQWRHDHEALILRARLAQVAEDLGDIPLALDIMGRIRQDHPGTPEAILAHERGALALAAFAVAVEAGEVSLQTYLISLRQVESFYRLDPVWPIARQALARAFERAGLYTAAASEYSALQVDLHRVDAPPATEQARFEIPLQEAEAWLKVHNEARAKVALARNGLPRFEDLATRWNRSALAAGMTASGAMPLIFNDPDDLAMYASAARAAQLPETASAAHQLLASTSGLASAPAEALHAVITAQKLGQTETATDWFNTLQAGELGAALPQRQDLFAALSPAGPKLQPLSREITDGMLSLSTAATAAARALLAQPISKTGLPAQPPLEASLQQPPSL